MKNLVKKCASVLGAAVLAVTAITAQANQLEEVEARGVLRVAVPQDFPPFGSVGPDLQPQGYDVDMASYLAEGMGVELELVPVTSANRIPYLQTRKVDLVISSLGKNPEREKAIDFSRAYAPFFLGVFGAEEVEVGAPEHLAGKVVGVTRGSVEDMELTELVPADSEIKRFEDNNTTLSAYLSGQVDLIATGNLVVATIAERNPDRQPVTKFMLKNSPCYIGVHKGDTELLEKVNALVEAGLADGTLEGFSMKWLKAPLPADLKG